jgi:hypothetical protein
MLRNTDTFSNLFFSASIWKKGGGTDTGYYAKKNGYFFKICSSQPQYGRRGEAQILDTMLRNTDTFSNLFFSASIWKMEGEKGHRYWILC